MERIEHLVLENDGKLDLSKIEIIAFREVVIEKVEGKKPSIGKYEKKGNMYPALAKLSCEYCASCHCATY